MVRLRPAVIEDVPELRAVASAAYEGYVLRMGRRPAPMTADYARAVRDGHVQVAVVDGVVVGLVVLVVREDHLLLENVAVSPSAQGRGVGGRLLAFAEDRARRNGLSEVRLYTNEAMTENLGYYPGTVTSRRTGQSRTASAASSSARQSPRSRAMNRRRRKKLQQRLLDAAGFGDVGQVAALLRAGADANVPGPGGSTPLYRASVQNMADNVRALVAAGADPNLESGTGQEGLPLCGAACWGHAATVRVLLDAGADPALREDNGHGRTAVEWADLGGHRRSLEILQPVVGSVPRRS